MKLTPVRVFTCNHPLSFLLALPELLHVASNSLQEHCLVVSFIAGLRVVRKSKLKYQSSCSCNKAVRFLHNCFCGVVVYYIRLGGCTVTSIGLLKMQGNNLVLHGHFLGVLRLQL